MMNQKQVSSTVRKHIYLRKEVLKLLEAEAKKQRRTVSNLVRIYIESALLKGKLAERE